MKKTRVFIPVVRNLVLFGVVVFVFMLIGCASSGPSFGDSPNAQVPIISPSQAVLLPGQTAQFSAQVNGQPLETYSWSVNGAIGGSSATGTISAGGLYTAPATVLGAPVQIRAMDVAHGTQSAPASVTLYSTSTPMAGSVAPSQNALVALYSIPAPQGSTASVQFGTTTAYGLGTSSVTAPITGGQIVVEVAGMRQATTYHMQATLVMPGGQTFVDTDKTFTTGTIPGTMPAIVVTKTPGMTPADGLEMLNMVELNGNLALTAFVTDTDGNVIWYYPVQPSGVSPMKPLPNGHVLLNVLGATSDQNAIQEIDLAGNVISQVTFADLVNGLKAIGKPLPILQMHHDVLKLPNGHLIILANYDQTATSITGNPTALGDIIVDWDPVKSLPVWTWSTFDHLDLNRAPNGIADWTHANALVYSPDDGALLLSMRNQGWVLKINYNNGAGDGSILWTLGQGGSFTLPAGQDPVEWNYGQHYPVIYSPNTAGIIQVLLFNNGLNRLMDAQGDVCGTASQAACYSSVPIYQLNEYTNEATVVSEINLAPAYSFCCGSVGQLPNGDFEYDIADDLNTPGVSHIQEVTSETSPQLVWQMDLSGQIAYRGFRIPSLYPGISWTQAQMEAANKKPAAAQSSQAAGKANK